jgi:hypothetical protein
MKAISKGTFLLLFVFLVGHALRAQDTRRMYFGLSLAPTWGVFNSKAPLEAGSARFGININLQAAKYVKQWLGVYFGLSLLNHGGHIKYVEEEDSGAPEVNDIVLRLQYVAVPLGIALTTPLKRNFQVNLQLGVVAALRIDDSAMWGDEVERSGMVRAFSPFYQATLSLQYHIGQDVYLHLGPSWMRSMTSVTQYVDVIQQSFGIRAGITF